jgi:hypothetical protein
MIVWSGDGLTVENALAYCACDAGHGRVFLLVNPRAYLHKVIHCIVHGWPQDKLRELPADRMLAAHPELYAGDPDALPIPVMHRPLPA